MAIGRNRCVVKGVSQKKVISHDELMNRIRKSLYYGGDTSYEDMEVSQPLAEYASELFSEPHKGHSLNRLNIVTPGGIHASPCALIIALIYLDRLNAGDPNYVRRVTPSELFIVSMMVSTKFYCGLDEEIYLSEWAEQGNICEKRLKQSEIEFLCAIDWNAYISNEQFFEKLNTVEKILAQREGIRRGWLTYTELVNFLPSFTIAKFFLNNIAIMAVSYAASVITIASAFFIVSHVPGNVFVNKGQDVKLNLTTTITTGTATLLPGETVMKTKSHNNSISSTTVVNDGNDNIDVTLANSIITNLENEYESCLAMNIEENLETFAKRCGLGEIDYENAMNVDNKNSIILKNKNEIIMNDNIWHRKQNCIVDNENCNTSTIYNSTKTYVESILWYLLQNQGKSLIEISLNWFKFI